MRFHEQRRTTSSRRKSSQSLSSASQATQTQAYGAAADYPSHLQPRAFVRADVFPPRRGTEPSSVAWLA
jgi:hypothetical protein